MDVFFSLSENERSSDNEKDEGETKTSRKKRVGGQRFTIRDRAVVRQSYEQHGVLHLPLPGYFLPKWCVFDQADITGRKTGLQTPGGGLILEHN